MTQLIQIKDFIFIALKDNRRTQKTPCLGCFLFNPVQTKCELSFTYLYRLFVAVVKPSHFAVVELFFVVEQFYCRLFCRLI